MNSGTLFGIGVGPGPEGYISLAAWDALQQANIIYIPRADKSEQSTARLCLRNLSLPEERVREIVFGMQGSEKNNEKQYLELANEISTILRRNQSVAYLTLGDPSTYSTYAYLLQAMHQIVPSFLHKTFPGITSFAAAAAALDWPLGLGKERILILPCPDDPDRLKEEIEDHDVVILMKIGKRLATVLRVLHQMGISEHCALASRLGLPNEVLINTINGRNDAWADDKLGYLTTMLISKVPRRVHASL